MTEYAIHLIRRDAAALFRIMDAILRSLDDVDRRSIRIENRSGGLTIDGVYHEGARHLVEFAWHSRGVDATVFSYARKERLVLTISDFTLIDADVQPSSPARAHAALTRWRDALANHRGATLESMVRSTSPAQAVLVAALERFNPYWHHGTLTHAVVGPEINVIGVFGREADEVTHFASGAVGRRGGWISPALAETAGKIFTRVVHVVPDDCEFRLSHTLEEAVSRLTIGIHPAVHVQMPSNPVERLRLLSKSPPLAPDAYLIAPCLERAEAQGR